MSLQPTCFHGCSTCPLRTCLQMSPAVESGVDPCGDVSSRAPGSPRQIDAYISRCCVMSGPPRLWQTTSPQVSLILPPIRLPALISGDLCLSVAWLARGSFSTPSLPSLISLSPFSLSWRLFARLCWLRLLGMFMCRLLVPCCVVIILFLLSHSSIVLFSDCLVCLH